MGQYISYDKKLWEAVQAGAISENKINQMLNNEEEGIKYFYYFEEENIIIDENGQIVYDIFRYITPSQLYLFKKDYGHSYFNMVGNNSVSIEIIPITEENCRVTDNYLRDYPDEYYDHYDRYEYL
jgi:hypothetical protein